MPVRVPGVIRSLAQAPLFSAAAIATFALGIGANLAVLTAVDRVLFRPLPYADPNRLVVMREYQPGSLGVGMPAALVVRARQSAAFEELTLVNWDPIELRFSPDADDRHGLKFVRMAYTALRTLGVRPILGADFSEEDARLQRHRLLISYSTWKGDFGGRPDVIGQRLWSRDAAEPSYEIAGVLPRDFIPPQLGAGAPSSGLVLGWQILDPTTRTQAFTPPIARLAPRVTLSQAQAEIDSIVASLPSEFARRAGEPMSVRLIPLREALYGRYSTYASAVLIAASLVLLVACANIASLMVLRSRLRERRTAIQLALGSSRTAIVRNAFLEAVLLAAAGGVVSVLALALLESQISAWLPPAFALYTAHIFDGRLLVSAAALASASAILATVVPSWRVSRLDVLAVLQARTRTAARRRLAGAGFLLGIEVAISTMLAVGAVLTGRTLANVRAEDVGFEPDALVTVSAYLAALPDRALLLQQYLEILTIIRGTPGVELAAGADSLPMLGIVNRPMYGGMMGSQRCPATGQLMETLGMRVVAGRSLSSDDVLRGAAVGVLSVAGLKAIWPHVTPASAIGRFLQFPGEPPRELVGVVSDVRSQYLAPSMPTLYVPVGTERFGGLLFAARLRPGFELSETNLARAFKARGVTPESVRVAPVSTTFESSIVNEQFRARLFGAFGTVAVILAMLGIYAVLTSATAARRTEFGIRTSLGASTRQIVMLVLRDGALAVGPGILVGLLLAWWAARFVGSMLYGIAGNDPSTFVTVAMLVAVAAGLAAWLPAKRASRVDPWRNLLRS